MTSAEFRAVYQALPADLQNRFSRLQRYVLVALECEGCVRVGVLTRLALRSAAAGVLDETATVLSLAELTLRAEPHTHPASVTAHRPRTAPRRRPVPVTGRIGRWVGTGPLTAATDASWKDGFGGTGFLTTDGRWGFGGHRMTPQDPVGPSKILVTELRAVRLLLSVVSPGTPMTVLVDSRGALDLLRRWRRGDTRALPAGCAAPDLPPLARLVARGDGLRFEHVKAHSGHLLNEAADALASIGRRHAAAELGIREAEERSAGLVDSFLRSWSQAAPLSA
ncbi:ribonuclease HI [Actinocorallia sp. A-T 12471]|uniref:ribonuclease HI n=1 Tax=Actinocorallia sp. A-T 12471 TaxID=3089813 RepID=UPI0029CD96BC|nr:RNase H family protein [Actinocorallia sp. A-T 12471]MDX6741871.1 RNase H family protein [Actinocorallia sp. A-T 12471]